MQTVLNRFAIGGGLIVLACHGWADVPLTPTHGSLIELGTLGPTIPAAPYYRQVHLSDEKAEPALVAPIAPASSADPLEHRLPLRSRWLTPGVQAVKSIPALAFFTMPVFVVGAEPLSFAWLSRHRAALKQRRAIGYVVDVPDRAAWYELRRVAGDLPLYPIDGDGLATELGLQHYPVLLSQRGIEP